MSFFDPGEKRPTPGAYDYFFLEKVIAAEPEFLSAGLPAYKDYLFFRDICDLPDFKNKAEQLSFKWSVSRFWTERRYPSRYPDSSKGIRLAVDEMDWEFLEHSWKMIKKDILKAPGVNKISKCATYLDALLVTNRKMEDFGKTLAARMAKQTFDTLDEYTEKQAAHTAEVIDFNQHSRFSKSPERMLIEKQKSALIDETIVLIQDAIGENSLLQTVFSDALEHGKPRELALRLGVEPKVVYRARERLQRIIAQQFPGT